MNRKFAWAILLLTLAGEGGWLLWRHRVVAEVRSTSAVLREQLAVESSANKPATQQTNPATAAGPSASMVSASVPLTPEERSELLAVRGQVARLQHELLEAAQTLAAQAAARASARDPRAEERAAEQRRADFYGPAFGAASEISQILVSNANGHGGSLPAALTPEMTSGLSADARQLAGSLEILPGETITAETDYGIFIAREREPRQAPNGEWLRLYLLANGNKVIANQSAPPDWNRWERRYLGMLRESRRRGLQSP